MTHTIRIDAPPSRVYAALLDPSLIPRWRVPDGMRCDVHEFDPREGGFFRVSLTYEAPDTAGKSSDHTDTYHGWFEQLVPGERVVERLAFETADPRMQGEMRIVTHLAPEGASTRLTAVHENLPAGVSPADNDAGWQQSLKKLARLLAATMLALVLQACGAQQPASAAGTTGTDTSALNAPARTFVSTLSAGQRKDALFPFDDPERTAWAYVPQGREGIPLKDMNDAQRAAAFGLLATGMGERGTALARGIIDLEEILGDLEGLPTRLFMRRDPGLYYVSLFAGPGSTPPWGWRFEGHHLSVNVTELGPHGQVVAPVFMGANPARIPSGPRAGQRLLAAEEDVAFELLAMLEPAQRARATIAAQTFGNIVSGTDPAAAPMDLAGLPASEMTEAQQQQLRRLVGVFAGRTADSAAASQLQRIDAAGFERLHFAWAGSHERGEPHYYRLHGPTVLIEYDNSQGGANHVHSVWRDLENDFGGDQLRQHYVRQPHSP